MGARPAVVTFTTDYGTRDAFVAVCKGVVLTGASTAQIVDITHEVPRGDVLRGARVLAEAAPYFPRAVHLAVVDPGVGTARRAVALGTTDGSALVGPDNGLLMEAALRLGGVRTAVSVEAPASRETTASAARTAVAVSRTFHGRDIFAPAAALLAVGTPVERLGPGIDPDSLVVLAPPVRELGEGSVRVAVTAVDSFGNVQLALSWHELVTSGVLPPGAGRPEGPTAEAELRLPDGRTVRVPAAGTFGDVAAGSLAIMEDSAGWVQLAVTGGRASEGLALSEGSTVILRARPS